MQLWEQHLQRMILTVVVMSNLYMITITYIKLHDLEVYPILLEYFFLDNNLDFTTLNKNTNKLN